ncbi:MAG: DoxX family protein [Nanoarchaeota archaeon]|nr:DoxX family protein [Nanoarchaeota archaeon]
MSNLRKYAPITVRIGISLVFLWFGFQQLFHPSDWTTWLPSFVSNLPFSEINLIIFNGLFESIFGLFLILGIYTRLSSALLSLHLIGIIFSIGYNEIAIRDFGLLMALISIFFNGADEWCLDRKLNK